MSAHQIKLPGQHIQLDNILPKQADKMPFYVKKFGFCAEKKFDLSSDADLNDILILFSLSGVVQFSHQQDMQYLSAYDIVISSCSAPLHFNAVSSAKWEFFYVVINGTYTKYYYNLIRTKHNVFRINPLSAITDIFNNMAKVQFNKTLLSDMHLSMLVHSLLYELYALSCDIVECKSLIPVRDTDVNNAIIYIKNNYKEPITIDSLCDEVCLSKYYFCKIFKQQTGTPIHKYINEYRVNKSKEFLSYSKLSINSIAAEVGFKNTLSYIRCFKQFTHMTPSEYRRNF